MNKGHMMTQPFLKVEINEPYTTVTEPEVPLLATGSQFQANATEPSAIPGVRRDTSSATPHGDVLCSPISDASRGWGPDQFAWLWSPPLPLEQYDTPHQSGLLDDGLITSPHSTTGHDGGIEAFSPVYSTNISRAHSWVSATTQDTSWLRQYVQRPTAVGDAELFKELSNRRDYRKFRKQPADEDGFAGLPQSIRRCLSFDIKDRGLSIEAPSTTQIETVLQLHLPARLRNDMQALYDALAPLLRSRGGARKLVVVTPIPDNKWHFQCYRSPQEHESTLFLFHEVSSDGLVDKWSAIIPENPPEPQTYLAALTNGRNPGQTNMSLAGPSRTARTNSPGMRPRQAPFRPSVNQPVAPVLQTPTPRALPPIRPHQFSCRGPPASNNNRRNHTVPRRFLCADCNFDFRYQKDLNRHRNHVPSVCGSCGQILSRADLLRRHMRTQHPSENNSNNNITTTTATA